MTYYTSNGYGAKTVEQARTILLVAMLEGNRLMAHEAHTILLRLS